ncbi:hypothetical protein LCGC14_0382130 [marine sediment metagenome]|uniref:Uncharacterized protein n=1 Tax=marine sediment metagenome TaxID=412755 RepID=A0A0F9T7Q3_9ZZZZ
MSWWGRLWRKRRYLTEKDDPVLARIWNNEEDAIYDEMEDENGRETRPTSRPL